LTRTILDPEAGWEFPESGPISFGDFVAELLELYQPPLRAIKTRDRMRLVLRAVDELVGPGATTAALTPALVARFIASRPDSGASSTTYSLVAYLRVACNYAKSRGYVLVSPFDFRKKWVRVSVPPKARHHPIGDIRRVLDLLARDAAEGDGWPRWRARRLLALVSLFAYTGLRLMEGVTLHADDVDLDRRMIFLAERDGNHFKTEASAQSVPIPDALASVLEGWMAHRLDREEGVCLEGAIECPWLFPGVSRRCAWVNGPMGYRPLDQIKAAGERAGVRGFTFQSLRHSFATHAESWGISPAMLQRVLRHTSLGTQKHYRHADLENMRAAVARIDFIPPDPGEGPTP
jgi:integrase